MWKLPFILIKVERIRNLFKSSLYHRRNQGGEPVNVPPPRNFPEKFQKGKNQGKIQRKKEKEREREKKGKNRINGTILM